MSRRSLAARIGAQTTAGGVVVVADRNHYRLLEDKHRLAGPPPGSPPASTVIYETRPGRPGSAHVRLIQGSGRVPPVAPRSSATPLVRAGAGSSSRAVGGGVDLEIRGLDGEPHVAASPRRQGRHGRGCDVYHG